MNPKYTMMMKNIFFGIVGFVALTLFTGSSSYDLPDEKCTYHKDNMNVVMRFELKVKPEHVAFLKQSFDACKAEVLAKEPGCLDYSLFQSYNDSTRFCLTEAWATKGDHNAHMELEHTKKYLAVTRGIFDPSFKSTTNYIYWICPGANEEK